MPPTDSERSIAAATMGGFVVGILLVYALDLLSTPA
jgi:hypothetical protein